MGRKRKPLIEKSTPILLRIDNKTLYKLCKNNNIKFNEDWEVLEEDTISQVKNEIMRLVKVTYK